ncbi:MAG: alpha/beta-hydrolase family protein [Planctomycetota bacterium]|nr:alpha/beta-hydrolase family protein [Planctomycetota bacterium]
MVRKQLSDYWNSFSFVGLAVAAVFFAASVSPSLLPRPYLVQGILSGFAIAIGYSLGVSLVMLYQFLEFPDPSAKLEKISRLLTIASVSIVVFVFLRHMAFWQDSIRERMEMPLVESTYLYRTAFIAIITAAILIGFTRLLIGACGMVSRWLSRIVPRRVSIVLSTIAVVGTVIVIGEGVFLRFVLRTADAFFLQADGLVDDGVAKPTERLTTGSSESLIDWDSIGRRGKNFIATGPTKEAIQEFLGRDAKSPIRVYAGMNCGETPRDRAELALKELIRVGAFERSVLIVATPTGTGWLDPGGVDTIEYLHAGDTAIVSTQYSYLPSWMTIVVEPGRSIESADALFDVVYSYWKTLPKDSRPKFYLHGLSLGALGSEVSVDMYSMFEDPIQGAVWSGPPFPSTKWRNIVTHRNPDSPEWLPTFRDGRIIRFTAQENALNSKKPWGPVRNVYIQYASDPMVFFSPDLLYSRPSWLREPRGHDVSPYLKWFPLITLLQIGFDLPMATSIPSGYGHNYAPANYIDAWIAVTAPLNWSDGEVEHLKRHFKPKEPSPEKF